MFVIDGSSLAVELLSRDVQDIMLEYGAQTQQTYEVLLGHGL